MVEMILTWQSYMTGKGFQQEEGSLRQIKSGARIHCFQNISSFSQLRLRLQI